MHTYVSKKRKILIEFKKWIIWTSEKFSMDWLVDW